MANVDIEMMTIEIIRQTIRKQQIDIYNKDQALSKAKDMKRELQEKLTIKNRKIKYLENNAFTKDEINLLDDLVEDLSVYYSILSCYPEVLFNQVKDKVMRLAYEANNN